MNIKRVLIVCSVYLPHIGGVETTITALIEHYKKHGIKTTVLTKQYPATLPETEIINRAHIVRIPRPLTESDFISAYKKLILMESHIRSDIVHCIGVRRPMPLFALLLARRWHVPMVSTFAGGDLPDPNDPETITLWREGTGYLTQSLRQSDIFTAFSRYTGALARKTLHSHKKINIIYGGINLSSIQKISAYSTDHPYILTARRLEKDKGINFLIEALPAVFKTYPEYSLIVAGDGSQRSALEESAKKLGIENKITFLGNVSQTTVLSLLKNASAHICPSLTESGGIINIEAQACGCLSIGSRVGGIPEYIHHNVTGYLFNINKKESLKRTLLRGLKKDNQTLAIIRNAKKMVNQYDWEHFAQSYINLYNQSCVKHMSPPFQTWSPLSKKLCVLSNEYGQSVS